MGEKVSWLQKHKEKREEETYDGALAKWQTQVDNINSCLKLAQTFNGEQTDQAVLQAGESLFFYVTNSSLMEERAGPGHWQGRSSGFSIPVAHISGSAIRYRVGATKGTYVQGDPVEKAVDVGTTYITDKRVIYQGKNQTREVDYSKLIGVNHDQRQGETTFSVSNRQKPITVHYGASLLPAFVFRLSLAIAHYKNTVPQLTQQLETTLAELQQNKPKDPSTTA